MHFKDSQVEITKLVVGPIDNNVFVVRCRQTGEAVLLDAATTLPTRIPKEAHR